MAAQEELREWVRQQMQRRGWSLREVAQRANIAHSTLSRMNDPEALLGVQACLGLARAFGVPPQTVFEMGGWLPRTPPDNRDTELLKHIYYELDENGRQDLLQYAEFLRDRRKR